MNDRELYQQKRRAQLDEWKAELDRLKARASGTSADAQLELNKQIKTLGNKIEEGQAKLAEIHSASDEAWDSIKDGVEAAWDSLKAAFSDAASKFKE
jgi:septal ring factor EnvC (AmiA/AmiB activator)